MKKLNFGIVVVVILVITSCGGIFGKGLKGSGNVVTQDFKVESFSELELDGVFNVILSQGDKEAVSIETDDNLMDLIKIDQKNNRLTVGFREDVSIRRSTMFNVYITLIDINKLEIGGVGDVSTHGVLELSSLNVNCSSVGDVKLAVKCKNLIIDYSSVGDMTLSGNVDNFELNNSAVGDVYAFDLSTDNAIIDNSAVGDVEVCAHESIVIESSAVGDVIYSGRPKIKNIEDNAVGDVVAK